MSFSRLLEKPSALYALAVLGIALVGLVDWCTGSELSFSVFYLAPVGLVAIKGRKDPAIFFSLLAAGVWAVVDFRDHSYSHWEIGYWNALVRLAVLVIVAVTVSRLREQAARERKYAWTDALTGLANIRAYYAALEREVERARRTERPLTVAYIDIDDFKSVNDERGHLEGDRLLRSCAAALAANVRAIDTAARLGGDEFALLLPETGAYAAELLLQRVRVALLREMQTSEPSWAVTFSIGAVSVLGNPSSTEELVRAADQAMYRVKKSGKDGLFVGTYEPQPRSAAAV
jgi:diguanylate cyclase (GGDEF)-like protein